MSESERTNPDNKSFLDKMFDGADMIIGGLEKSKELSDPYPEEKIDRNEDKIIDAEFTSHKSSSPSSSPSKPKLIWGFTKEYHIFEGFTQSSICGSFFEPEDITDRKTEMDGSRIICCGICLRILHSKYVNA
jgi:hypothetical protein